MRRMFLIFMVMVTGQSTVNGAILRVPQDHATIQSAVNQAGAGDVVLVQAGTYRERLSLRPGVIVRSAGDENSEPEPLARSAVTILDGGGQTLNGPGVSMAEGSVLDGFTVTNVGLYDQAVWDRHFASQGEELGDDEGASAAEGTTPAILIQGVTCTVTNCQVHHNGDVGISAVGLEKTRTAPLIEGNLVFRNMGGGIGIAEGAEAIVRDNICRENLRAGIGCRCSNPILVGNECTGNIRAGIGCREGARPVIRGNRCLQNRRAGIGIRMAGTAAILEENECLENEMAGIGCRDEAHAVLVRNVCRLNKQAGIGVQDKAAVFAQGNRCDDNRLVALGVTGGATATLIENDFSREGGVAPIIAVREGASATIQRNRISGGGIAAIVIQGTVLAQGNTFTGRGDKQGQAIWVWENSSAVVADNSFHGYRTAVVASRAHITVTGNRIRDFQGVAIQIKESLSPANVSGNQAFSGDTQTQVLELQGPAGVVTGNETFPDSLLPKDP